MNSLKLTLVCLTLLLLTGCGKDTAYHTYRSAGSDGWMSDDTLDFRLPSFLTSNQYSMQIGIKHTGIYPYKDLWLAVLHPCCGEVPPDTFHLRLADEDGRWLGKGTQGSSFQYVSEQYPLLLQETDTLLQIIHLMDTVRLRGVTDVGVRLAEGQ